MNRAGFLRFATSPFAAYTCFVDAPHWNQVMPETPNPPTRAELTEQKLRLVRKMIDQRKPPGEMKRLFAKQYGTTPRAAERFITEVYQQIRGEVERAAFEHKADSYNFWLRIVANESLPVKDRMRAQENLDRILGTHAPTKMATTDTSGNDVPVSKPMTSAEAAAEAIKLLDELRASEPPNETK